MNKSFRGDNVLGVTNKFSYSVSLFRYTHFNPNIFLTKFFSSDFIRSSKFQVQDQKKNNYLRPACKKFEPFHGRFYRSARQTIILILSYIIIGSFSNFVRSKIKQLSQTSKQYFGPTCKKTFTIRISTQHPSKQIEGFCTEIHSCLLNKPTH